MSMLISTSASRAGRGGRGSRGERSDEDDSPHDQDDGITRLRDADSSQAGTAYLRPREDESTGGVATGGAQALQGLAKPKKKVRQHIVLFDPS